MVGDRQLVPCRCRRCGCCMLPDSLAATDATPLPPLNVGLLLSQYSCGRWGALLLSPQMRASIMIQIHVIIGCGVAENRLSGLMKAGSPTSVWSIDSFTGGRMSKVSQSYWKYDRWSMPVLRLINTNDPHLVFHCHHHRQLSLSKHDSTKLLNSHSYIIIMEKTEAGLRGLCVREIDVTSQILVTKYYSKLYGFRCHGDQCYNHKALPDQTRTYLDGS